MAYSRSNWRNSRLWLCTHAPGSIAAVVTEGRNWYTGVDLIWRWQGETSWVNGLRLVEAIAPFRETVQQACGKVAAVSNVIEAVCGRYGDGREDVPAALDLCRRHA